MVVRFFRDGSVYVLAGLTSQGIMFLLFPFLAHIFEPREYGVLDLLGLLSTLALMLVSLEIAQGLAPYYADASAEDQRRYASTALIFSVATFSAFAVLVVLLAEPLTRLVLGPDVDPTLMRLQVGATWTLGVVYLAQDLFRWQLRPRAFALASVGSVAAMTGSGAILIFGFGMRVEGALLGQVIGAAAGLAIVTAQSRGTFTWHFDVARCRRMLAFSLPLVPSSVGVFLNGYADRLAIQAYRTLADVGIYGVAFRLSLISWLVLVGFQGALLPLVLSRHDLPQTPAELARIFRLFCALALGSTLVISVFADEVLRVLTKPAYYEAASLVPLVVPAAFLAGMWIFAPGMAIRKRSKPVALIAVFTGALNLGLSFALVSPLGVQGAAIATLVSSAIGFALIMRVSQRLWRAPHQWALIGVATFATATFVAAGAALPPVAEKPSMLAAKLLLAAGGIAALWALLVDRDEWEYARDTVRRLRTPLQADQRRG